MGDKRNSGGAASDVRVVARNRKARHEYEIHETLEAGVVLTGTEVKSLREGRASLAEAYARVRNGEVWLIGAHIDEYTAGNRFNHDPRRERKLLLHAREIRKLKQKTTERGYTLAALELYFVRQRAKVLLALASGKKQHDRREDLKERDTRRQLERARRREDE